MNPILTQQEKEKFEPMAKILAANGIAQSLSYTLERKYLNGITANSSPMYLELLSMRQDLPSAPYWIKLSQVGKPIADSAEKCFSAIQKILTTCFIPNKVQLIFLVHGKNGIYEMYLGLRSLDKEQIDATFVDPECTTEELNAAFKENTKAVFGETIANPALVVLDLEKFAAAAHAHGVPFIVDNTFATPINCRPFEWGADIVTHSTTKYMDGHAACVGGAIVDSGNFDWEAHHDKFKGLTEPDESYHGIVYTQKFGRLAYIQKATAQLMRDLGSIQSPQNAFLINIGLETLHLRVPRHCESAFKVASYLQSREDVAWVKYPGLPGDKYYELAQKYMPNGTCGVISFGLKGGRQAASVFMDKLKLCSIETHVADSRTAVLHPASHTHRQLNDEQLVEAGVDPSMIRFSCGIEDAADIIEDIRQALEDYRWAVNGLAQTEGA